MEARYVFAVRFRVEPTHPEVSVDPATFETRLYRAADPPGEAGWRFFRDNLWRGELTDPEHFRRLTGEALDATVTDVSYRALETDPEYLEALRAAIAEDLAPFRADSVEEVLSKYLGSSVEVRDEWE